MAPQSRDRLYVAYWHESLGRDPDWDKWMRPAAWCESCDEQVTAVQVFKRRGQDMGRYRSSYVYRCPRTSCRNAVVEPAVLPASAAIDWTIEAQRIGDRKQTDAKPEGLAPATVARIRAGMAKYWEPLLVPAGGTWRTAAAPVSAPFAARTTRETDGLALPPLFVPVEGRDGKVASPGTAPMRAQTTRRETGIALPPFVIPMRGGGDAERARDIHTPLHTVSAGGNHHGLIEGIESLLVPYYGNGEPAPVGRPVGAIPTRDRYALASPAVDIADVRFRMLEPHEIARAMAFVDGYIVLGDKRAQVKQYGNAVTPPAAELIVSALVEAITGTELERMVLAA
jgi:DNA (cytosine-5)-methyltransferase 1